MAGAIMILGDIITASDKMFVKSEWAPVSDRWPALSFTRQSIGRKLRALMNPARDVVIYVGTSDERFTRDAAHRRRLLSVLRVEPHHIRATEDLVPAESWDEARTNYPGRFLYSFPVLQAWDFDPYPLAPEVAPLAYRSLGWPNQGDVVEVGPEEKASLLQLPIRELTLQLQDAARRVSELTAVRNLTAEEKKEIGRMERFITDPEDPINGEIARMAALIDGRVSRSGALGSHFHPYRAAPPINTPLILLLTKKWFEQNKRCALCMAPIRLDRSNPLLQPSPDRIESCNPNYDEGNLSITHLACNLAKNKHSVTQFEEWLSLIRGLATKDESDVKSAN
ncbi:MAG TPA: hypothetical protein VN577_04965 [Terriglobales bacterium]|nr:hypothetical protein [Terriglobales bacterium]